MKLRIKGNTIRLRLLRSEVEKFGTEGNVVDETSFGSSVLRYSLRTSPEAHSIGATFDDGEIAITIPEHAAREWTVNEQVGFEAEQKIDDSNTLSIIIEKDFVCLDRPDDPDRADAYPNPNQEC